MLLGAVVVTIQRFYMFHATVHTNEVSRGNKVANHNCWIFSKCQQKGALRCIDIYCVCLLMFNVIYHARTVDIVPQVTVRLCSIHFFGAGLFVDTRSVCGYMHVAHL